MPNTCAAHTPSPPPGHWGVALTRFFFQSVSACPTSPALITPPPFSTTLCPPKGHKALRQGCPRASRAVTCCTTVLEQPHPWTVGPQALLVPVCTPTSLGRGEAHSNAPLKVNRSSGNAFRSASASASATSTSASSFDPWQGRPQGDGQHGYTPLPSLGSSPLLLQ